MNINKNNSAKIKTNAPLHIIQNAFSDVVGYFFNGWQRSYHKQSCWRDNQMISNNNNMTKKSQTVLKAYRLSNKKKHNMNKVMLSHNKKFKCSKRVSVKNRAKRVTFDINAIDIKSESTTICNRDVFQFFFWFSFIFLSIYIFPI